MDYNLRMQIKLARGVYVVAVSGGVDSVVLLDLIHKLPNRQLIVAHFDHGIRADSGSDRLFVAQLAEGKQLPYVYAEAKLGSGASEAKARLARYAFLERVKRDHSADAIVTAHHQDDVLETAILNLSRGTGRRGLTALADTATLRRPLLEFSKKEILSYAQKNSLSWQEDATNQDDRYLRNYIRHQISPRLSAEQRQQFLQIISALRRINRELDAELVQSLRAVSRNSELDRKAINSLPPDVRRELLATWWRGAGFNAYESKTFTRVLHDLKACHTGATIPLKSHFEMRIGKDTLALVKHER